MAPALHYFLYLIHFSSDFVAPYAVWEEWSILTHILILDSVMWLVLAYKMVGNVDSWEVLA